jgi:hypothetical protein
MKMKRNFLFSWPCYLKWSPTGTDPDSEGNITPACKCNLELKAILWQILLTGLCLYYMIALPSIQMCLKMREIPTCHLLTSAVVTVRWFHLDRAVHLKHTKWHHQCHLWESYTTNHFVVRFGGFTAGPMKNSVFWDVTPCGSCKNRRFGRT